MTTFDQNVFDYTATGQLGFKRETMLENCLHMRDKLGRSKTYCHHVPSNQTHGITFEKGSGVPEAMRWPQSYQPLIGKSGKSESMRDFVSLNREAVRNGLVSAKEISNFRAMHDIVKTERGCKSGDVSLSRRVAPSMVYGISTRPSTPIHELLAYKYQNDWLDLLSKQQREIMERERSKKIKSFKPSDTRSSLLRTYMVPVPDKELWIMPRFKTNIDARISSFRNDKTRDVAMKYHVDTNCAA